MGADELPILWMHAGFLGGGVEEPVLLSPLALGLLRQSFWTLLLPLVGGDAGSCCFDQRECQY